jgi:serine/threonine protein kinase
VLAAFGTRSNVACERAENTIIMKSLSPNTLLQNRYLVVNLIGKGGMGEVYLAIDQRLGSHVALKRTFFTDDEVLAVAFEREARTLANLRHKALTKVSDHFNENGEQFLVMEYISGEDLTKRLGLSKKSFPLNWVLFWADELLDALAYLHTQEPQIIHRDIKPQNLKLTSDNHVILLDFGLAKNSSTTVQSTTSGSSIVGYTPHYAPMEQIRGLGTSPKSDIYSLSATLYQLMTNVVPPDALSRADELLNGNADCVKPLNFLNAEIPVSISNVVLKGMALRPDDRYTDAREMQVALREAFANQTNAQSQEIPPSQMETEQFTFPVIAGQTDFSATMQMDSDSIGDKTEVMLTPIGDKTEVMLTPSFEKTEVMSIPNFDTAENIPIGEKTEIMPIFPQVEQLPADNVTVPFINFDKQTPFVETAQTFDSASQELPQPEQIHQSLMPGYEEPQVNESAFEPVPLAVTPAKQKSSSSKMFAILGIVGLFGVLAIGGGGTAWYMLKDKATVEVTPTPKVTPQIESSTPTPTPELPIEAKTITNTNSLGNTSVNNAIADPKKVDVKPTPNSTPTINVEKPKSTPTPFVKPDVPPAQTPRPAPLATKTPAPLTPPKSTPTPKKQPTVKPEIF